MQNFSIAQFVKFAFSSQIQNSFDDFNNFNNLNISMRFFYDKKMNKLNYKNDSKFSFDLKIFKIDSMRIELFKYKVTNKIFFFFVFDRNSKFIQ